ncbi:unnamed protein product [Echinostoma caproni]|uniref:3-dehydroquinate synthase n=1 Tax=Echinostoma caproni TaxID=27848 RepID=A0A183B6T4_9TREM|nr:unnamed protein product [Echinostoma caproni]
MQQTPLPIYFYGQNILPTIHVLDLANVIQNISDNPPKQRYIVVKDDGANTLAEIVQAISSSLSTGEVLVLDTPELVDAEEVPQSTVENLTMDLRIDAATIKEEMQVRWLCETGIVDNMPRVVSEFIEAHNLKVSDH